MEKKPFNFGITDTTENENILSNTNSVDALSKKVMINLHKGILIGSARSIIIDYREAFNLFNIRNEFEFSLGDPDIRHYDGENVYCPDDLRYVSTMAENDILPQFIQIFFPISTLYVVLDHILGGSGNGEYEREISDIDKTVLDWYFEFYTYYSDKSKNEFYHKANVDVSNTTSIKSLFRGLNIILAYVPILLYNKPFSEIIIRINLDKLEEILYSDNENDISTIINEHKSESFSVKKMSTDEKLDDIVKGIFENR